MSHAESADVKPGEGDQLSAWNQSTGGNSSYGAGDGALSIDFRSRFVPYTTLSAGCLLFNGVALTALGFVRGPRTVHHRLLANLTVGDVVGTFMLWLYYNSPYIFPRFEVMPDFQRSVSVAIAVAVAVSVAKYVRITFIRKNSIRTP